MWGFVSLLWAISSTTRPERRVRSGPGDQACGALSHFCGQSPSPRPERRFRSGPVTRHVGLCLTSVGILLYHQTRGGSAQGPHMWGFVSLLWAISSTTRPERRVRSGSGDQTCGTLSHFGGQSPLPLGQRRVSSGPGRHVGTLSHF